MTTLNQVTPITINSLPAATTITGDEPTAIVQGGATVQAPINQYPQGFSAGVIVYGVTGGSPFPHYRTLKAGTNIAFVDGGSQGDLTISVTPGTGTGSVTDVSVVTANGVSGSVANSTTTPEITLTLGAITPSSIAASGSVTGSNLSGTNTGDQTISLTGDITGSGTGSFATTLATVNSNVGSFTNASITVNGKGLITAASSGTAPVTSVSGTSNRITSSGGATPVIDISASYVGQSSITTLGTIGTGVWQGTIITSGFGGTGNGFTKFSGPASSEKTFTLPNASSAVLTDNAAVTVAQGGTGGTTWTSNALLKGNTTSALVASGVTVDSNNAIAGYLGTLNTQTGTTYTLNATDAGKIVEFNNASAITATLPSTFGTGYAVTCVQKGAGQVTFSPAAGASLSNASSFTKTRTQYSFINLYVSANSNGTSATYYMGGDGA